MNVIDYFLELAAFDNVHPNEAEILNYIKSKLDSFGLKHSQDSFGNIVALISSTSETSVALCGHVDIAAPLRGRKIIRRDNIIKTDGKSLLGGDDKTAVAAMLWLAEQISSAQLVTAKSVELIFTTGEEAGMMGAKNIDYSHIKSDDILVFDWLGRVNRIIVKSPAYIKLDVSYTGRTAHPAEWQKGINAGQFLLQAASTLQQGEYKKGVTFNIGRFRYGEARNQVSGFAELEAEVRAFDLNEASSAAEEISKVFEDIASKHSIKCAVSLDADSAALELNTSSKLVTKITRSLAELNLEPYFEETFGCFDANIFAGKGKNVVVLGGAYYNPHGPEEYVNIDELYELCDFIGHFCCKK